MQVEINDTVLEAMRLSVSGMYNYAAIIKGHEEFSRTDSVGDALRNTYSNTLTQAAIVKDFVLRCDAEKK